MNLPLPSTVVIAAGIDRKAIQQTIRDGSAMETETGCWIWKRRRTANNHPTVRVAGKVVMARRVSYLVFGKKPALGDHVVKDTCGNSLCVNPNHLVRGERTKGGDTVGHSGKRSGRYPWRKWMNLKGKGSRSFVILRGVDYSVQSHAMAIQIRSTAVRYRLRTSIRTFEDRLEITLTKREK